MDVSIQGAGRATAFSSTTIREAAYVRIQEEIRSWQRYHNELSLVFRLPPELLVEVFKYNLGVHLPSYLVQLLHVTHVCSHWRRVALECPSLWSRIPFHRPTWAKEMLARSKMAPLTIMLIFSGTPIGTKLLCVPCEQAPAVKATMSQLSRIKELALHQGNLGSERFTELVGLLDSPAPLLESLDISFLHFAPYNKLPYYLFAGEAPQLSRLRVLTGCLNWRALPFMNLKSLKVLSAFPPPAEHIISALSNMPFLESFECDFRHAGANSTSTQRTAVVNLPLLVDLAIACDLPTCAFLLDHITYPTTIHAIVMCKVNAMHEHGRTVVVSLTQRLAHGLIRKAQQPIRSLEIHLREIILDTCPDTPANAAQNRCRSQLHIQFFPLNHPVVELMADTIQALPSLGQTEILVVDRVSLPRATWMNHLRGLSRLKSLEVGSGCAGFLTLRRLTISNWTFNNHCNYPEDGPRKSCYNSLKDCLKARQEAGLALEMLVLDNCRHVQPGCVAALRKFVKNVVTEDDDDDDSD
ncbi:hypothetical protein FPV67DRAFT_272166 [Lyophyllum atratum]|nr:hypothetical protein FPV67DRAFT_272166 [Lyophyllum atratum]